MTDDDNTTVATTSTCATAQRSNLSAPDEASKDPNRQPERNEGRMRASGLSSLDRGRESPRRSNKQKRLLMLYHSLGCPHNNEHCPVTRHCGELNQLWKHMAGCSDRRCSFPHCVSSKQVLAHYHRCQNSACRICQPLREEMGQRTVSERASPRRQSSRARIWALRKVELQRSSSSEEQQSQQQQKHPLQLINANTNSRESILPNDTSAIVASANNTISHSSSAPFTDDVAAIPSSPRLSTLELVMVVLQELQRQPASRIREATLRWYDLETQSPVSLPGWNIHDVLSNAARHQRVGGAMSGPPSSLTAMMAADTQSPSLHQVAAASSSSLVSRGLLTAPSKKANCCRLYRIGEGWFCFCVARNRNNAINNEERITNVLANNRKPS